MQKIIFLGKNVQKTVFLILLSMFLVITGQMPTFIYIYNGRKKLIIYIEYTKKTGHLATSIERHFYIFSFASLYGILIKKYIGVNVYEKRAKRQVRFNN